MHSKHAQNDRIEVLRAVAILFTIVQHFKRAAWDSSGFLGPFYSLLDLSVGVDLFLVISGFVITRSLIASGERIKTGRRAQMASFWIRRIFRLLPTAWLWLTVALLLRWALRISNGELHLWWVDAVAIGSAFLNAANLAFTYCVANPETSVCDTGMLFIGHYWSLSLEEQFYILFPLLFFFIKRPLFIALLVAAIALQFFWTRPAFTLFWFLKTDALCWGILLALASYTATYARLQSFFLQHKKLTLVLSVASVAAIPFVGARVGGFFTMTPYGVGTVALLCMIAVYFASIDYTPLDRQKPLTRWMLYIGSRSYALYVIHLIVFDAQRTAVRQAGLTLESGFSQIVFDILSCTVGVVITFALAELNYRWVETPWRNRGREVSASMLRRARGRGDTTASTQRA